MSTKVVRKRKLSLKKILIILLLFYIIGCSVYYFIKLPIKNIYITGTVNLEDALIIEAGGIKNYPAIFKVNNKKLEKKLLELDLIKSVVIKKSITGKLTIEVVENKILFYNRSNDKIILDDKTEIENNQEIYGIPILINYVPDKVYDALVEGISKIDEDIIYLISEIEYSPSRIEETIIDDSRFLFRMNDGNHIYINTPNIDNFKSYPEIYSTLGMDNIKGTLNLDSSIEDSHYFKAFGS